MAKNVKTSRTKAERSVNEMQKDFEKRIDTIKTELAEKGPEAVEKSLSDLKTAFDDRFNDMRENLENFRENLDDALETGRTTIQERPLMAVGVAAAVGIMIGLLFGRRGRD